MSDDKKCCTCDHAKPRKLSENGDWWFCGKHKTFITEMTLASWVIGCKGKDYKKE